MIGHDNNTTSVKDPRPFDGNVLAIFRRANGVLRNFDRRSSTVKGHKDRTQDKTGILQDNNVFHWTDV